MTNVSEILFAAATHIRVNGLHKGSAFANHDDKATSAACLVAAVDHYAGNFENYELARNYTMDVLGFGPEQGLVQWSDDPETTADMVVSVLDIAGLRARTDEAILRATLGGIPQQRSL